MKRTDSGKQVLEKMNDAFDEPEPARTKTALWKQAAVKWPFLVLALIAAAVAIRRLPVAATLDALESRIDALGVWGPAVFGLVYAVAVVALAPASPFTLAAGAMFGLVVGTITASLSSTAGAALAFLAHKARSGCGSGRKDSSAR